MFESLELLDRNLFLFINGLHTPLVDRLMWVLSQSWHTYLLVAVVAYAIWKKISPRHAAAFLLGCALVVACTDVSSNLVKHGVKRFRPTHNTEIGNTVHTVKDERGQDYKGGQYGFFSGHAANSFGLTVFVFLCIRWWPARFRVLIFLYPLLICYSRIYLGVHYPSDILAGLADGLLFGWLIFLIVTTFFVKFDETPA